MNSHIDKNSEKDLNFSSIDGEVHGVVVERCAGSHSSRHLTGWGASPC